MSSLQEKLDAHSKKATVTHTGEVVGQIVINNPISLNSSTNGLVIVGSSPTVSIQSKGVQLENVYIHCDDENAVALKIKNGCSPLLKDVYVRGRVEGLPGEEGHWELPNVLELSMSANKSTKNRIYIYAPIPARVRTVDTEMVQCEPSQLAPGINVLHLTIKEANSDCYLSGKLIFESNQKDGPKRVVPFYGHPGRPSAENEVIFLCASADVKINCKPLKQMPPSRQHSPYEFLMDHDNIQCRGLEITVTGLPNGLLFQNTEAHSRIHGKPLEFGLFPIVFTFCKDGLHHKFKTTLDVQERKLVDLELQLPNTDPFVGEVGTYFELPLTLVRTNSSKLSLFGTLPSGLMFDKSGPSIKGILQNHGDYRCDLEFTDGFSRHALTFNIRALPHEPLTLNYPSKSECEIGMPTKVSIHVVNAAELNPNIQLTNTSKDLQLNESQFEIEATLSSQGELVAGFVIQDRYGRSAQGEVTFECPTPKHVIRWTNESTIDITESPGNPITIQLTALIDDNPYLKPTYAFVNQPPMGLSLNATGLLSGTAIAKDICNLQVKAVFEEGESTFTFKLRAKQTGNIVEGRQVKNGVFVPVFQNQNPIDWRQVLKDHLTQGTVGKNYQETLYKKVASLNATILVQQLPPGLMSTSDGLIKGIPTVAGTYQMVVSTSGERNIHTAQLKVTENAPPTEPLNKPEKPKEITAKLGKAFKIK